MADPSMQRTVIGPIHVVVGGIGSKTVDLGHRPLYDYAGHAYTILANRILIVPPGGSDLLIRPIQVGTF